MLYRRLVDSYERISETTRRTEMAGILVELLKETPPDLVHQIVYLTQGKLYPEFVPIEMRMAERLTLKAVAQASGSSEEGVSSSLASTGDLGGTAQDLLEKSEHTVEPRLQVDEVYRKLDEIARTSGTGSIARKIDLLVQLLSRATPIEAKYLIRTVTGKLRLGLADMTLLDALAIAYGGGKG
ncbi:MAG: DNA ligase, partial [Chloroflexi bacterium]|nr:DNA ligase [Chloroflexota bacterium]